MTAVALDLIGRVLYPDGTLERGRVSLAEGLVADGPVGRVVDIGDALILPGIIDIHGDGHERHLAPRRGAMTDLEAGLRATEAELAANGITTALVAQFWSWEGGLRGPDFARKVFPALAALRGKVATQMLGQLRFETSLTEDYKALPGLLADWGVPYIVFNDHLPHDRLAQGRRPQGLTGQALKAGRNPEKHLAMLMDLHARQPEIPAALDALCLRLAQDNVRMGSHDDHTPEQRETWHGRGVRIAEFPETLAAAEAARSAGDAVIMGAPNLVRGGSHKGNVSALDLVSMGLVDALASDYHYPSPRMAAWFLQKAGVGDLAAIWAMLSTGPARILGLHDRGSLTPGLRADVIVLDPETRQVEATLAGGQVTHLKGETAHRFLNAA